MTPLALFLSLLLAKGLALPGPLHGREEGSTGRFRRSPGISTSSSEEEDLVVFLPMQKSHKELRGEGSDGKFKMEEAEESPEDNEHIIVVLTEEQFPLDDLEKLAQVELSKFEEPTVKDSAMLGEKLLGLFPKSVGNRIDFRNLASDVPPAPLSLSLAEDLNSSGENVTPETLEVPFDDAVRFPIETLEDLALIVTVLNNTNQDPEELAAVMQLIDTEQKLLGSSTGLGSLLGLGGAGGENPFVGQLMGSPFGSFLSGTPLGSILQGFAGGSGATGAGGSGSVSSPAGGAHSSSGGEASASHGETAAGGSGSSSTGGGSVGGGAGAGGSGGSPGSPGALNCFPQGRMCQTYVSMLPCCEGLTCQAFSNSLLNTMTMGNVGQCG